MLSSQTATGVRSEDVDHLGSGLVLDVGGDMVRDQTHGIDHSGEVIGEACDRDEVRDKVKRQDDISQSPDHLCLHRERHAGSLHHVVQDEHVVNELRAQLGCTLGHLVPELGVRIIASVVAIIARI